jgi:hypothetical protein
MVTTGSQGRLLAGEHKRGPKGPRLLRFVHNRHFTNGNHVALIMTGGEAFCEGSRPFRTM